MIKQIYKPYWDWECYKSGMWNKTNKKEEEKLINIAVGFTGNHVLYGKSMKEVIYIWKNTMLNHLTNKSINRRAFLGHCAVFYKHQIPQQITRIAWKRLTNKQRYLADKVAEETIKEWELWLKRRLKNTLTNGKEDVIRTGFQMKLPFY